MSRSHGSHSDHTGDRHGFDNRHQRPADGRRRSAHYEHFAAEIMRESADLATLARVEARILGHPDVVGDAELAGQIRSAVGARRAELLARQAHAVSAENALPASPRFHAPAPAPTPPPAPSPQQVLHAFERVRHDFEERLAHFDLVSAATMLGRLSEFNQRHSDVIATAAIDQCRADLERRRARAEEIETDIDTLTDTAITAAEQGRHTEAAQSLRRLTHIHASWPALLGDPRFGVIRESIEKAGAHHAHREAARQLVARERAAAAELRRIHEAIAGFREVARRQPRESPAYAAAEKDYRAAVRMVEGDRAWLADLIVELDELLDEVHDESGRAAEQVEHFLESVRRTLTQLRAELPGRRV